MFAGIFTKFAKLKRNCIHKTKRKWLPRHTDGRSKAACSGKKLNLATLITLRKKTVLSSIWVIPQFYSIIKITTQERYNFYVNTLTFSYSVNNTTALPLLLCVLVHSITENQYENILQLQLQLLRKRNNYISNVYLFRFHIISTTVTHFINLIFIPLCIILKVELCYRSNSTLLLP